MRIFRFCIGGNASRSVARWGVCSRFIRRKLRALCRKNAGNVVLPPLSVRKGKIPYFGLALRPHCQRFCGGMERAPKTFLQTPRGPRALHSGRTHPRLHSGYGGRPAVAALRLGARRKQVPACATPGHVSFPPLLCFLCHSSATAGLPPPPTFRQGSVAS